MRPPISIITSTTDPQRSGQHAIHAGVRSEPGAQRLEPLTPLCLEVSGDGDHDGGRLQMHQVIDQLELLFWSQGGLQDDHLVGFPVAGLCLAGADGFDRDAQPRYGVHRTP